MRTKKCTKCGEIKHFDEFHKHKSTKDGFRPECKICRKQANKKRYEKNKKHHLDMCKKWRENNKERKKENDKKYYTENKTKMNEAAAIYYVLNKKDILKVCSLWRENNKERKKENDKKYYKNNKEKIRQYKTNWQRNKRKTDDNFRIKSIIQGRIRTVLKIQKTCKSAKTLELIGMPIDEYKDYLKSTMTEDMTWNDFMKGKIHIDHIIPCSSFDLTNEEEQGKCFHWSNTQLLWAKDNLEKSDKLDWSKGEES